MMKYSKYILLFLLLWVACTLAIRLVHEPDLWWQIRTGEWIIENGEVPKTDVFSYTYPGTEWVNVKWGYEVIQALVVRHLGAEFLPILQLLANVALVFLLWLMGSFFVKETNHAKPAITLAILLFLAGYAYRMNARPELVSYLLTAVYLYIFHQYHRGNKKIIWLLVPLQMAWVNLHEAYGVGVVLMGVFGFSAIFSFLRTPLKSNKQQTQTLWLLASLFVAVLANAVHPWGFRMIFHPLEIFSQLGSNKFTAEILGIASAAYWHFPAYINLLFLLLGAYGIKLLGTEKSVFTSTTLLKKIPLFHLLLWAAFFYLSTRAYRNIPFFLVVSTPLVAVSFLHLIQKMKENVAVVIAIGISIFFYFSVVSNAFYKKYLPSEVYGMGVNPSKTPIGAAEFIKANALQGPAYTDYLSSSYLLWALQPDFKTFVDLRDLDIFEEGFIQTAINTYVNPEMTTRSGFTLWQFLDDKLAFNYVALLNNPQFGKLHRHLLIQPNYHLIYADQLMSVYVKESEETVALIEEFSNEKVDLNFQLTPEMQPSTGARTLAFVFWPGYRQPVFGPTSAQYNSSVQQLFGF